MTDKEILEKAIQKAIDGGWPAYRYSDLDASYMATYLIEKGTWPVIIYSKNFAKALWGDDMVEVYHDTYEDINEELPAWQYHLQQMVIADDPIKYLGANI